MSEDLKKSSKEIIETIKSFSVAELNELVRQLEVEFQVSASNFAAPTAAAGGKDEGEESQEAVNKDLFLVSAGTNKIGVIKLIRELTSLGLMEAKKIADSAPSLIKSDITLAQFEELKVKFEEIGATVEFKSSK
ncbi:50S ribosomal protein L7/L12 [Mycoplasma parvum]|uniref:Large ribosomal subunit protein bL12 n=1 Tax=Mycoplasma parvum str. Indiana TaxID=1403316 RepID=U5NBZ4_9MOLU|nr:50S ribosomal protein L7/L12 [Mycoplasma parvum]AGX89091.1 50S ribosomal protein L7/L12 [Mycoplasma parvum str. Indiana]